MFISKKKFNEFINQIKIIDNHQEAMWKTNHKLFNEINERICKLEKIVENQPLIKKYQKTLDIFLKNAQD